MGGKMKKDANQGAERMKEGVLKHTTDYYADYTTTQMF